MIWHQVRVWPAAEEHRAAVVDTLVSLGSSGVQDEGASLLAYLPDDVDVVALRARLGDARAEITDVEPLDIDWHGTVRAHTVGTITVAPPWLPGSSGPPGLGPPSLLPADDRGFGLRGEPVRAEPALRIIIDPGMAFGTGEHETTRGVLALMQAIIRPGDVVADLGAGSAVLAIAAAALGAARVAAIEMDPDAIGNAEENVARNGVRDSVRVIEGDATVILPLLAPVRVVLANIISSVLIELLPAIAAALSADGAAVLSGILTTEREHMVTVLTAGGWRIIDEIAEGEWWSVAIRP